MNNLEETETTETCGSDQIRSLDRGIIPCLFLFKFFISAAMFFLPKGYRANVSSFNTYRKESNQ